MQRSTANRATTPRSETRDLLARWRQLTRQANVAFDRSEFADAQRGYWQALKLADDLIGGSGLKIAPDDCLVALVVTHHNLAEAYRRHHDIDRAREHLCLAHQALGRIACDPDTSSETRCCAMRHANRTRLALLDWQTANGHCPHVDAVLRDCTRQLSSARVTALH
jgi:hypothetical protein